MADNIDIAVKVTGDAEAQLKKISQSLSNLETASQKASGTFSGAFGVLAGVVGGGAILGAFNKLAGAAHQLFDTFVVEGIHAAQEQEVAINKLSVALAAAGNLTKETRDDLIKFAEGLQATTKFSDEAIIATEALLESLANLDSSGLKQATQASLDLSAALGIDLETATRLVGKAANGEVSAFKRFGVEIQKGADDAATFANALDVINSKFGGAAAGQVNTFAGAVAQFSNIFNDVQEAIGNIVIENEAFIAVIKEAGKILSELKVGLTDNSQELKEGLAQALILTINVFAAFSATLDAIERVVRILAGTFNSLGISIAGTAAAISQAANGEFSAAFETIKQSSEDATNALTGGFTDPTFFGKTTDALGRLGSAAQEGFAKVKEGADSSSESIKNNTNVIEKLTDAQIKAGEEGVKLAEKLVNEDISAALATQNEQLLAAYEQRLIDEETFLEARQVLREDYAAKEVEELQKRNEALRSINDAKDLAEIEANNQKINSIIAAENQASTKIINIKAKQAEAERKIEQQKLEATASALGNLASLTQTKSKELFAIGKAAALAEAIVQGALAVQKALAAAPPPFNSILAASVAVKTAVQVATISAQQLATGIDSVPGSGTRDNFPALLAPGERVVPRETNKDLTRFLEQQSRESELIQNVASQITNQQQQIVVQVGSEQIINVINDQLRSGRALAI